MACNSPCFYCKYRNCYDCSFFYLKEKFKSLQEDLNRSKYDKNDYCIRCKLCDLIYNLSDTVSIKLVVLNANGGEFLIKDFKNKAELIKSFNYIVFQKDFVTAFELVGDFLHGYRAEITVKLIHKEIDYGFGVQNK